MSLLVWLLACASSERAAVRPPPLGKLPEPLAAAPPPSISEAASDSASSKDPPPIRPKGLEGEPLLTAYPLDDLDNIVTPVRPESVHESVLAVYTERGGEWLWSDGRKLRPAASSLVTLLDDLSNHGVRPELVDASVTANLASAAAWNAEMLALDGATMEATVRLTALRGMLHEQLDIRLTASALALARVLSRTDQGGAELGQELTPSRDLDQFVAHLTPADPRYPALVNALRRYAKYRAFPAVPKSPTPGSWRIGARGDGIALLRDRLAIEGFASGPPPADPTQFDRSLDVQVRRFQWSRGLPIHGVVDTPTAAALAVQPDELRAEIQEALRAVRQSTLREAPTYLLVNIPEFTVDLVHEGRRKRRHRAIIGYAYGSGGGRTRLMAAPVTKVTINPGWTPSDWIIANELRAKEAATPGYLYRTGFRPFTRPDGRAGLYQLPGDQNALGRVTMHFENEMNLYLHGTPDETPFALASRAMSHGCVRVQDIEGLAIEVLALTGTLAPADFERNLDSRRKVEVPLTTPIPMAIEYVRVSVEDDGIVRFLPNVYRL